MIERAGWAAWLSAEAPRSRTQARAVRTARVVGALLRNPLAALGLAVVGLLVVLAAFAPDLAPHSPYAQDLARRLEPPSIDFLLGTDHFGRDLLSRVLYGTRTTLIVILLVAALSAPLGLVLGSIAGYFGGWLDWALMRLTDVFLAFPKLVLALALVAALGPGLENAIAAIALTAWPPYARVARAETLSLRERDFVNAARMAGAGPWRIVLRHLLPLCVPSVVVRATLDMAGVILIAAGLGFLGLGAQPPSAEWGAMIADGRRFVLDQWWVAAMPGLAILIVSLGFNLLGDGLRDALDPGQS